MTFAFSDIPTLSGKTAIVTGANTGIGLEIARGLSRKGARVVLACRDADKANAAMDDISSGPERADLAYLHLDLANIASVRDAAEEARKEHRIDLLINNAGVMFPPLSHGSTGCELQFAVNHLGHFAFTGLLLDKLAENGGARVVSQSSIAHRDGAIDFDNLDASQGYSRSKFYSQSKLANLLFAFELDRRLRAAGSTVKSAAAHPGVAQTNLTRHMGFAGKIFGPAVGLFLNSSDEGALPAPSGGDRCRCAGRGVFRALRVSRNEREGIRASRRHQDCARSASGQSAMGKISRDDGGGSGPLSRGLNRAKFGLPASVLINEGASWKGDGAYCPFRRKRLLHLGIRAQRTANEHASETVA